MGIILQEMTEKTEEEIRLPVRLERDSVIAREFTQILLKFSKKLLVPLSLVQRHKGVYVCKFFPCDRLKSKKGGNIHICTYCNSNNKTNFDNDDDDSNS